MHRDSLGLIVQQNGDGGDTLQRTGFYYLPGLIKGDRGSSRCYDHEIDLLSPQGLPTRHPTQYPLQKDVSRDQLTPNIVALGFIRDMIYLPTIFVRVLKNFFRYPNNSDFASPEHINHFLRAGLCTGSAKINGEFLNPKAFLWFPILLFGDLFMLLGVIIRCIQARDPDNVGDDLNTLVSVVQAQYTFPTPISYLARKLYLKFRPKPLIYGPPEVNNIYMALKWYFRPDTGANPEIAVAWKEICAKL